MKRFLLTTIIFLMSAFSAFSASECTLQVKSGTSFVSLPCEPSTSQLTELFAPYQESIRSVVFYDAADKKWKTYIPEYITEESAQYRLPYGAAFYITAKKDMTISFAGEPLSCARYTLRQGWNHLGFDNGTVASCVGLGLPFSAAKDSIYFYDVDGDLLRMFQQEELRSGRGYVVYIGDTRQDTSGTGHISRSEDGAPGLSVSLSVGSVESDQQPGDISPDALTTVVMALQAGNNFVSLQVQPASYDAREIFAGVLEKIESIRYFSHDGEWISYYPSIDTAPFSLQGVAAFYITVTEPVSLSFTGVRGASAWALKEGWNMYSVHRQVGMQHLFGSVKEIYTLKEGVAVLADAELYLKPGQGYWMNAVAADPAFDAVAKADGKDGGSAGYSSSLSAYVAAHRNGASLTSYYPETFAMKTFYYGCAGLENRKQKADGANWYVDSESGLRWSADAAEDCYVLTDLRYRTDASGRPLTGIAMLSAVPDALAGLLMGIEDTPVEVYFAYDEEKQYPYISYIYSADPRTVQAGYGAVRYSTQLEDILIFPDGKFESGADIGNVAGLDTYLSMEWYHPKSAAYRNQVRESGGSQFRSYLLLSRYITDDVSIYKVWEKQPVPTRFDGSGWHVRLSEELLGVLPVSDNSSGTMLTAGQDPTRWLAVVQDTSDGAVRYKSQKMKIGMKLLSQSIDSLFPDDAITVSSTGVISFDKSPLRYADGMFRIGNDHVSFDFLVKGSVRAPEGHFGITLSGPVPGAAWLQEGNVRVLVTADAAMDLLSSIDFAKKLWACAGTTEKTTDLSPSSLYTILGGKESSAGPCTVMLSHLFASSGIDADVTVLTKVDSGSGFAMELGGNIHGDYRWSRSASEKNVSFTYSTRGYDISLGKISVADGALSLSLHADLSKRIIRKNRYTDLESTDEKGQRINWFKSDDTTTLLRESQLVTGNLNGEIAVSFGSPDPVVVSGALLTEITHYSSRIPADDADSDEGASADNATGHYTGAARIRVETSNLDDAVLSLFRQSNLISSIQLNAGGVVEYAPLAYSSEGYFSPLYSFVGAFVKTGHWKHGVERATFSGKIDLSESAGSLKDLGFTLIMEREVSSVTNGGWVYTMVVDVNSRIANWGMHINSLIFKLKPGEDRNVMVALTGVYTTESGQSIYTTGTYEYTRAGGKGEHTLSLGVGNFALSSVLVQSAMVQISIGATSRQYLSGKMTLDNDALRSAGFSKGITGVGYYDSATRTFSIGVEDLENTEVKEFTSKLSSDIFAVKGLQSLTVTYSTETKELTFAVDVAATIPALIDKSLYPSPDTYPSFTFGGVFRFAGSSKQYELHANNIQWRAENGMDFTFRTISFTNNGAGWSATGVIRTTLPNELRNTGTVAGVLPEEIELAFTYGTAGFIASVEFSTPPVINVGGMMNIGITNVSITKCSPWGVSLGAQMNIGNTTQSGYLAYEDGRLVFRAPENVAFTITVIPDHVDVTLTNLQVGIGQDVSVASKVIVKTGANSPLRSVLGAEFEADLERDATSFMFTSNSSVKSELDLGSLGKAVIKLDSIMVRTTGSVSGKGSLSLNGRTVDLVVGQSAAGVYFTADFGERGITAELQPVFQLAMKKKLGIESMYSFQFVRMDDASISAEIDENNGFSAKTTGFKYVVPSSFPPAGIPFFDDMKASIRIVGFEVSAGMQFPLPDTQDMVAAVQAFAQVVNPSGELTESELQTTLKKMDAPSVRIYDVSLKLPKVKGFAWDSRQKTVVYTDNMFAGIFGSNSLSLVNSYTLKPDDMVAIAQISDAGQLIKAVIPEVQRKGQINGNLLGFSASMDYELRDTKVPENKTKVSGLPAVYNEVKRVGYVYDAYRSVTTGEDIEAARYFALNQSAYASRPDLYHEKEFTYTFTIKPKKPAQQSTGGWIVQKGNNATVDYQLYLVNGTTLRMELFTETGKSTCDSLQPLVTGVASNILVAVNLKNGTVVFQINGNTDAVCSVTGNAVTQKRGGLYIGRREYKEQSTDLQGDLTNVLLYDKDILTGAGLPKIASSMKYAQYQFLPDSGKRSGALPFDLGAAFTVAGRFVTGSKTETLLYMTDKSGGSFRVEYGKEGKITASGAVASASGYEQFWCSSPQEVFEPTANYAVTYNSGSGKMQIFVGGTRRAVCGVRPVKGFRPEYFDASSSIRYNEVYDGDISVPDPVPANATTVAIPAKLGGGTATVTEKELSASDDLAALEGVLQALRANAGADTELSGVINALLQKNAALKAPKDNSIVMEYQNGTSVTIQLKKYLSAQPVTAVSYSINGGKLELPKARFGLVSLHPDEYYGGNAPVTTEDTTFATTKTVRSVAVSEGGLAELKVKLPLPPNTFITHRIEEGKDATHFAVAGVKVFFDIVLDDVSYWTLEATTKNGLKLVYDAGGVTVSSPDGTTIAGVLENSRLSAAVKGTGIFFADNSPLHFTKTPTAFRDWFMKNRMGTSESREYTGTAVSYTDEKAGISYSFTPIRVQSSTVTGVKKGGSEQSLSLRFGTVTAYQYANYEGASAVLTDDVSSTEDLGLGNIPGSLKLADGAQASLYHEPSYTLWEHKGSFLPGSDARIVKRKNSSGKTPAWSDGDALCIGSGSTEFAMSSGPDLPLEKGSYLLETFYRKASISNWWRAIISGGKFSETQVVGKQSGTVHSGMQMSAFMIAFTGAANTQTFDIPAAEKVDITSFIRSGNYVDNLCINSYRIFKKSTGEGFLATESLPDITSFLVQRGVYPKGAGYALRSRSIKLYRDIPYADMDAWSLSGTLSSRVSILMQYSDKTPAVSFDFPESQNQLKLLMPESSTGSEQAKVSAVNADGFEYPAESFMLYSGGKQFAVSNLSVASEFIRLREYTIKMPAGYTAVMDLTGAVKAQISGTAITPVVSKPKHSTFAMKAEDNIAYTFTITPKGGGFYSAKKQGGGDVSVFWQDGVPMYVPSASGANTEGGFFADAAVSIAAGSAVQANLKLSGQIRSSGEFYFAGKSTLVIAGYTISDANVTLSSDSGLSISGTMQSFGQSFKVAGYIRPNGEYSLSGAVEIGAGGDTFSGIRGTAVLANNPKPAFTVQGGAYFFGAKMLSGNMAVKDGTIGFDTALKIGPAGVKGSFWYLFRNAVGLGYDLDAYIKYSIPIKIYGVTKYRCKRVWGVKVCVPSDWGWKTIGSISMHEDLSIKGELNTRTVDFNFGVGRLRYDIPDKKFDIRWGN